MFASSQKGDMRTLHEPAFVTVDREEIQRGLERGCLLTELSVWHLQRCHLYCRWETSPSSTSHHAELRLYLGWEINK